MRKASFWVGLALLTVAQARAAQIRSFQTGLWTSSSTWQRLPDLANVVPTAADDVDIRAGHEITIDSPNAGARYVEIRNTGILSFSRVMSSALTMVGGDIVLQSGGVLDMGREPGDGAGPIPTGITATLILAKGSPGSQYVLNVGGGFTARGADKDPVALASSVGSTSLDAPAAEVEGWTSGDLITIGQTERTDPWQNQTEERVITSVSGGAVKTVSWSGALAYVHDVADGVRVANLTRNVVLRSSMSAVNQAAAVRIDSGAQFRAAQTEFSRLGDNAGIQAGIYVQYDASALISSCSLHHGDIALFNDSFRGLVAEHNVFYGNRIGFFSGQYSTGNQIYFNDIAGSSEYGIDCWAMIEERVVSNSVYSNALEGIFVAGRNNVIASNHSYANGTIGLRSWGVEWSYFGGNETHDNADDGMLFEFGNHHIFFEMNRSWGNGSTGMSINGSYDLFWFGNESHSNMGEGVYLNSSDRQVMSRMMTYDNNPGWGLYNNYSLDSVFQDLSIGYDAAGTSRPDNYGSVSGPGGSVLKGGRINAGFDPGVVYNDTYYLSYNLNFATGTAVLNGRLTLSDGKAINLDYAQPSYRSTATAPVLIRGSGHSLSVTGTSDAAAVTQLVSVRRLAAGGWEVSGSSSGVIGAFSGTSFSCPQFSLDFAEGPSPQPEDRLMFHLSAASADAGRQKRLLFDLGTIYPGSRSSLTVASGGSLALRGAPGFPTRMDRTALVDFYYPIVSSGAITLENAEVRNTTVEGLQIEGTASVSISSTVFDFMANDDPVRTYVTARDAASSATFTNVAFGVSRSTASASEAYNVRVLGSGAGLDWAFNNWSGAMAGPSWEFDPGYKVRWMDGTPPAAATTLSASPGAADGELTLSWTAPGNNGSAGALAPGAWRIFMSTDAAAAASASPGQAQVRVTTVTTPGALHSWTLTGLLLGATQHVRLWTEDETPNISPISNAASAASGRFPPEPALNFAAVSSSNSVVLGWSAPAVPPSAYRGGFDLEASSVSSSGPWLLSVSLPAGATSYLHGGLAFETTYYYRLFTLDTGGGPAGTSSPALASARTADVVPAAATLSAGPRSSGASWTPPLSVSFTKPMLPATVAGAVSLHRVMDNLGTAVDEAVSVSVSSNAAGDLFTLAAPPLSGNSLYELRVATSAMDAQGKALGAPATASFRTLMDRAVRNVVPDAGGSVTVDFAAMALSSDGYLEQALRAPSDVAAATRKMQDNTGDALRRPLAGSIFKLEAMDGAGALQSQTFSAPVSVSLSYPDLDGNGVVDGTNPPVLAKTLSIHWLDETRDLWVRLPSSLDAAARRVTAPAAHFTVFALLAQSDTDLSGAYAFPSPWTPASGVPFMTFTGLSQAATIRVYTVEGGLVREMSTSAGGQQLDWDLRTGSGDPVATGVYYYEVSNAKERKTGKLAVIR